jgi:Holliday junction resolvase
MTGGRAPRRKGQRADPLRSLQAYGLAAERMPLSGAAGGRFSGDIVLPLLGRHLCVEVKASRQLQPI